ncbi:MAG TPA: aldo/keto reductase [Candidatus Tumulicola sp.]|nr:aldo/keto reductase [Candidatus Tumulicola sp.]
MRRKPFGGTGVEVAVIGQGTWNVPESGAAMAQARRALQRGIELGMTHVDTAEMYGAGRVEEFVGEAIAGVARERLFVTTKVLPSNARYRDTLAAAERSLQRLRLEYVDLYLLHWPSEHPLEETMAALERLVLDGKARFIGVSNFDEREMLAAAAHLREVPLRCNQVLNHLNERGAERLLPAARQRGIAVVGYTPFGRGRFPRAQSAEDGVLGAIARRRGATVRQVILAFLTRDPALFAIPKASREAHVEENAGAADVRLDERDIAEIDAAFPLPPADAPLATL